MGEKWLTEFFVTFLALKSAFKFGVGGTDENYTDYWNTASAYARANQATKESDEKDD